MDLKREYKEFNREYFDHDLPDDVRVTFSNNMPKDAIGGCHIHGVMECKWTGRDKCVGHSISIRPFLKNYDCLARMTLLHEMAHLRVGLTVGRCNPHSYKWQTEMRRLVKIGAFDDYW
jgi:hypothetical protein